MPAPASCAFAGMFTALVDSVRSTSPPLLKMAAAAPLTSAAACDVPSPVARKGWLFCAYADGMLTAGAASVGSPDLEKYARRPLASTPLTEMTPGYAAGQSLTASPSLPSPHAAPSPTNFSNLPLHHPLRDFPLRWVRIRPVRVNSVQADA